MPLHGLSCCFSLSRSPKQKTECGSKRLNGGKVAVEEVDVVEVREARMMLREEHTTRLPRSKHAA